MTGWMTRSQAPGAAGRAGGQLTRAWQWLGRHDHNYAALRRAGRAAIIMPLMFALGDKVIGNADVATFAAFGSFAMLLLVDFSGPMRERVAAQAALVVAGSVLVCLGTLASRAIWLAVASMVLVGFAVIFAGVVSSVLAGATTSLLLAFILPVTLSGPASSVPARLAGWGMAGGVSVIAVALLWPAPAQDPLRAAAARACRALAARLRAEVAHLLNPDEASFALDHSRAVAAADDAVMALHRGFLATAYRPTGLSTAARTVVRLVDELNWLNAIVIQSAKRPAGSPVVTAACAVKVAAAAVLERGADLLAVTGGEAGELHAAMAEQAAARMRMEQDAMTRLPVRPPPPGSGPAASGLVSERITALDPSFRAQELSFAVSQIAGNIDLTAAAERRSWPDQLLGRQPAGISGALSAAGERAAAHVDRHSVWLHNSVRGAAGLGLAVLVAHLTGAQHSFWVVLGTLSVLRSNALSTGQNVVRGMLGTVAGFVIGAALLAVIGTNTTLLWILLPLAILLAGVAPAAISFAGGQAGFTLTLVILFNIIQPAGWRVGLLRVEDIALGCAVSLVVGLLFWPRGAASGLGTALADAYADTARYLGSAVNYGVVRCDGVLPPTPAPRADQQRAAAAGRRLDDAFRNYLAESGVKHLPLPEVATLITGVTVLRLSADAVVDLWSRDDGAQSGNRTAARNEVLAEVGQVTAWYQAMATALTGSGEVPTELPPDPAADARLVDAVRHDLTGQDGQGTATAVRMIWTSDHVAVARRLQGRITEPVRVAVAVRQRTQKVFPAGRRRRATEPSPATPG